MRLQGYDKTPDFKMHVPFGQVPPHCQKIKYYVTSRNTAVGGTVINWIESKALFANETSHKRYNEEQLQSYYNRHAKHMCTFT